MYSKSFRVDDGLPVFKCIKWHAHFRKKNEVIYREMKKNSSNINETLKR